MHVNFSKEGKDKYGMMICALFWFNSWIMGVGENRTCSIDVLFRALDHHKADGDSHAAAEILLRYMQDSVEYFFSPRLETAPSRGFLCLQECDSPV